MSVSWKSFDRWARSKGYTVTKNGKKDEVIEGVDYADGTKGVPIATERHNSPDEVPPYPLQEIAYRLGITKRQLEEQMNEY